MSKITDLPDKPSFQLVEIFSWFAFGELISATDLQRRIKDARRRQYSQLRGVAEPDSIIRHCEAITSGEFSATQLSEDGPKDDDLANIRREHQQFLGWVDKKWAGDHRRALIRARTWALLQHRFGAASLQLISNRCRALHVDGTIELRGIEVKDGKALTGEHSLIPPEYSLRPWILDIEGGRAELYPVAEGPLSLEAIFADADRRTNYIESVILREHALALLSRLSRDADRSVSGSGHSATTRRGRPVGAGSCDYVDAPIVESILALMAAQPGLSAAQATREYPGNLPGTGSQESREKRIARKVRGTVQPG